MHIGTVLQDESGVYQFLHIKRLTPSNRLESTTVLVAFVEGLPEVWLGDEDHLTDSVAQLAAYYDLISPGLCSWIDVCERGGWRNPTTPYIDQNPELYRLKDDQMPY